MDDITLIKEMNDADIRIQCAWPFPMVEVPDELADCIETYERLPEQLQPLLKGWSDESLFDLFGGAGWRFSEIWLEVCNLADEANIYGWIGVAASPVYTPTGPKSASYSWGHYHTQFIFGANSEEFLRNAINWAQGKRDAAFAEWTAEQEGQANG